MNTGFEANSFVVKLARAVPGDLFEQALITIAGTGGTPEEPSRRLAFPG